jgi:hypothetical protein
LATLLASAPAWAQDKPEGPLTVSGLQTLADECGAEPTCAADLCEGDFDFCSLRDDELASLALASDPQVTRWMANKARRFKDVSTNVRRRIGNAPASIGQQSLVVSAIQPESGAGSLAVETIAGRTVEQQVALAAAGLARLIADRGKQESAGWALDTLGNELCGDPNAAPRIPGLIRYVGGTQESLIADELQHHYLRSFCALAASPRLTGYGAGTATLQVVRNAVENDAKDLPGAVIGRGIAELFYDVRVRTNGLTADEWLLERAKGTGADVARRYADASTAASTALTWWGSKYVAGISHSHADALGSVSNAGGVSGAREFARLEAEANLTEWDLGGRPELSDDKAAPKILAAVGTVHDAAGQLTAYATAVATSLQKGTPASMGHPTRQDLDAALRSATNALRIAEAAEDWSNDGATLAAIRGTTGLDCTHRLTTITNPWPEASAAADLQAKACASTPDPTAGAAFPAAFAALERAAARTYAADPGHAAALVSALDAMQGALAHVPGIAAGLPTTALVPTAAQQVVAYREALAAREAARSKLVEARTILLEDREETEVDVREATRVAVRRVVDGGDPLVALGELARTLDAANRRDRSADTRVLYSTEVQAFACVISFPSAHRGVLDGLGATEPSSATIAAALTTAPACWEIFGKGHRVAFVKGSTLPWTGGSELALDEPARPERIERLTTAMRLYQELSSPGNTLVATWKHLTETQAAVATQLDAFAASNRSLATKVETEGLGKQEIGALQQAFSNQMTAGRSLVLLQLTVMDDALDLASTLTGTIRDGTAQVNGLCVTRDGTDCHPPVDLGTLDDVDEAVGKLRDGLTLIKQVVSGKPSQAVASALGEIPNLCRQEDPSKEDACRRATAQVATYGAGLAALAEAETADDAARALNTMANPPGGWKVKQIPQTTTVSITAYPGLAGGAEWRFGPNGVVQERGKPVYGVAPTLAMPVGLDVAFAPHWACQLSLLDPAAFLQYDVSQGGSLPEPNLLTVLSPGANIRWIPGSTPFGAAVGVVYRPNLRSAEGPAWASTGANVFQLYLSLNADVTLVSLHGRNPNKETK